MSTSFIMQLYIVQSTRYKYFITINDFNITMTNALFLESQLLEISLENESIAKKKMELQSSISWISRKERIF